MTLSRSTLAATATTLALLAPLAAQATPVSQATVIEAFLGGSGPASVTTDTETTPNGTATADVGSSNAIQNADGTSTVAATIPGSGFGEERVTSVAAFTQVITNMTGIGREYVLSYALSNLSTDIRTTSRYGSADANPFTAMPGELIDSIYTAASFEYDISVNGTSFLNARADVLGTTAYDRTTQETTQEYTFENVEGFDPSISLVAGSPGSDWRNQIFAFAVADIFGDIGLGPLAAGESFEVVSTLTARAYANRGEGENSVGGFAADPVQVRALSISSSAIEPDDHGNLAVVPLPASGFVLLGALGGAMALRRRK